MAAEAWYVHVQGETLGPFSAEKLRQMLAQNRFQFADFAWHEGLTKWARISDLDEFQEALPPYPKTPVPRSAAPAPKKAAPVAEEEPPTEKPKAPAKAAKAKPATEKINSRFIRIPLDGKITCAKHGTFRIHNVAERGIYLESNNPPDVGTELKFKMEAQAFGKTLEMTGIVIRHAGPKEVPGFALEFTRVNPAHKRMFEEYVREWLEK